MDNQDNRQHRQWRQLDKPQVKLTDDDRRAIALQKLVATPEWQAVIEQKNVFLKETSKSVQLNDVNQLLGYLTSSLTRDTLEQFIAQIEQTAAKAPDPADFRE